VYGLMEIREGTLTIRLEKPKYCFLVNAIEWNALTLRRVTVWCAGTKVPRTRLPGWLFEELDKVKNPAR
jgi:hypothetical protein